MVSFPGAIIGFREGLEAFLVVAVALRFLGRSGRTRERKAVWLGAAAGVVVSAAVGLCLYAFGEALGGASRLGKLWESGMSLLALALVTGFILWMMRHGSEIGTAVQEGLETAARASGVGFVVAAMVLREGVEVALFGFAGTYAPLSIAIGILASLLLVLLVFFSLVKIDLTVLFNLTLGYLILQAGFLLGYGLHEGLSAMKEAGLLAQDSGVFLKAFDLSKTVLDHKEGVVGIPLYALLGWYSRPEWLQFAAQYAYTAGLFAFWAVRRGAASAKRA